MSAYVLLDPKGAIVCGGESRYCCFTHLPHENRDKQALKMIEKGFTVIRLLSTGFYDVTEKMVKDIGNGNSHLC